MKPLPALLPLLLLATTCQKPSLCPEPQPPAPSPQHHALVIQGHYHPQSCRTFFDARLTPAGNLIHDDTAEPTDCQSPNQPFSLQTFIFPVATPDGQIVANYKGLRLESRFPLSSEGFQLSTADHPDLQEHAAYVYTFTTHTRYTLQAFFPETLWDSLITVNDQLNFSFQVTSTVRSASPDATLQFILIQGQYHVEAQSINISTRPIPISLPPVTPAFQFQLIDSIHTLRIRSIYTLLTEDFAVWSDDQDCSDLQNWDLRLIPAAGYNLLGIQFDPPYLECLKEQGIIHFRIALLK